MAEKAMEIDFVITWVDGDDAKWKKVKSEYKADEIAADDGQERYRNWELLRYWFRGAEKYAPWVRKIHFVTADKVPEWLDQSHPKLHIVRHEDFIPKEYLPTFNSHVPEIWLHRIEGLAEHFVYFNDDVFVTGALSPEHFFRKGLPVDMLAFQPVVANPHNPLMSHLFLNNTLVLSKYFSKRENVRKHPGKYFHPGYPLLYFVYNLLELAFPKYTGFYTVHGAFPFLKSTFAELWEKEGELLRQVSSHRFRNRDDVTPYLFREWQKLSGNFRPGNVTRHFRYFEVGNDNRELLKALKNRHVRTICVNDVDKNIDFEKAKEDLGRGFEAVLPKRASFEEAENA